MHLRSNLSVAMRCCVAVVAVLLQAVSLNRLAQPQRKLLVDDDQLVCHRALRAAHRAQEAAHAATLPQWRLYPWIEENDTAL
eukprot:2580179-Pleurochrysis_carterae.AAC.1